MVALAAMQGMGKPGSNIWATTTGTPVDCSFVMDGYAEGGISGDVDNTAAGFRWVYRMFPHGGATRTAHHSTEGQFVDRLRIPEALMGEKPPVAGQGLLRQLHREPVQALQVSGVGLLTHRHVLPVRRLLPGHHDREQPVGSGVPGGRRPLRRQPERLVRGRDEVRRHRPARLHQPGALRHRGVGQLLGLRDRLLHDVQPPGDRAAEEVHRAARRVQVRLPDLRRAGQAPGRLGDLHRRRQDRVRLGQAVLFRLRPSQAHQLGRVREEGLLRGPAPPGCTSRPRRPSAGSPKTGSATRPTGARTRPTRWSSKGLQTASGKIEFVSSSLTRFEKTDAVDSGAPGPRPAVPGKLGRPPHRRTWSRNTPCR